MRDPDIVFGGEHVECPICDKPHRLRRHGYYSRHVVLPGHTKRIRVVRLLCHTTGQTVSLLPEFCLPRRQVGTVVLSVVLHGVAILGQSVEASVRRSRASIDVKTAWSLLERCRNHHRAFDEGLFGIHPDTLELRTGESGPGTDSLQLPRHDIQGLEVLPHPEALTWAWKHRFEPKQA